MSQTEFTNFENSLINREVPFLFKCTSVVNFAIIHKYHTLPLHKCSSFLLVSLMLSSKSWSHR